MKHILIADDDELIRRYLTILLERAGYRVTAFSNGNEVLSYVKANYPAPSAPKPFDLLITDLTMPGMGGLELLEIINKEELDVPAMVITGSVERSVVIDALRKGCYEFLDKPIVEKNLLASLERAMKKIEAEDTKSKRLARLRQTQKIIYEKVVGKYRLKNIIGEGACGTVYLAEDLVTQKKYALKILRLAQSSDPKTNEAAIKRFIHESRAICQVQHPAIINFIEFGYVDNDALRGAPFIVMEYFPGNSLRHFIGNNSKIEFKDKISLIRQIAEALSAVHKMNILHRDIKPDNILVNADFKIKITDFGACHLPASDLTMTSELIGSPSYMAPEYLRFGKISKLLDIYALGVLSYELFIGKKPFEAENISELIEKIFYRKPPAPAKIIPGFPEEVQDVLAKMLRKKMTRRYQDASEIVNDLLRFEKHAGKSGFFSKIKHFFTNKFDWIS